jgi:uncharacterized membrane protein
MIRSQAALQVTRLEAAQDEIGKLAAIADIRTAHNFFLQREVQEATRGSADKLQPSRN